MQTWGVAGRGVTAVVGTAVVVLACLTVQSVAHAKSPWAGRDPGDIATVAGVERDPEEARNEPGATQDGQETPTVDGARPGHVAVGPDGTVYYIAEDWHQVGAVAPDGTVEVFAGAGGLGFSGDGGPAAEAELDSPDGLAVDEEGVVYVAGNERVRMIDQDGVISTVAGTGPGEVDEDIPLGDEGPATEAGLTADDVAVGPDGSLYIADGGNDRIRRVDPDGVITTVAGGGYLWNEEAEEAAATEASLSEPGSVAVDAVGNVYFVETWLSRVRMISPDGVLTTIAGDSDLDRHDGGFAGDGGPAVQAELNMPVDVAVGPDGGVYVADMYNVRVRRIDPDGTIDTVAGTGERGNIGDDGAAVDAAINGPTSVAVGPDGSFYLTSPGGGTARRVDTDGTISTLAAVSGGGDEAEDADDIELNAEDIAAGPGGSVYVADGDRGPLVVNSDGSTSLMPAGEMANAVVSAGDGSFYVATVGGEVHHVYADGGWIRVAGGGDADHSLEDGPPEDGPPEDGDLATAHALVITDLAVDPDGVLHMLHNNDGDKTVYRLEQDDTLAVVAELGTEAVTASGLDVDGDGGVYRAYLSEDRVVRTDDGDVTTVASAVNPHDVAVAVDGTLYIAGQEGVHRVDSGGASATLYEAPEYEKESEYEREYELPGFRSPRALSTGPQGDVYFVDTSTEQVRVIVEADEVPNPFPWGTAAAVGLPLIVFGAAFGVWRRRQLGGDDPAVTPSQRRRGRFRRR